MNCRFLLGVTLVFLWSFPRAQAAPVDPAFQDLSEKMAGLDARIAAYESLRERSQRAPSGMPRLSLPRTPKPLGALDERYLGLLSRQVLAAIQARVFTERDRGFSQWERLALPPRRVQMVEPRLEDGQGAWTHAIFQEWDRGLGRPEGLPELGTLLTGLGGRLQPDASESLESAASIAPEGDLWDRKRRELEDAVETAATFPMRHVWRHGTPIWSNSDHWARISERAEGAAEACVAILQSQVRKLNQLASRRLGKLGSDLELFPEDPANRAVWDRSFDQKLLPSLPTGIRWAVERRLAGAYFLGAWQAKQSRLGWWSRFPALDSQGRDQEMDRLGQAKRTIVLSGKYLYQLEPEAG